MAYFEIRKHGKLKKRRPVDDERARKGCSIRLGSKHRVKIRLGQSKVVGDYQLTLFEGEIPENADLADGQPRIVDFGLAKISEKENSDLTISAKVFKQKAIAIP